MEEVPQLSVYRTSLCLPATARAYAQESIPDDFARSPPRPRAPLSLGNTQRDRPRPPLCNSPGIVAVDRVLERRRSLRSAEHREVRCPGTQPRRAPRSQSLILSWGEGLVLKPPLADRARCFCSQVSSASLEVHGAKLLTVPGSRAPRSAS